MCSELTWAFLGNWRREPQVCAAFRQCLCWHLCSSGCCQHLSLCCSQRDWAAAAGLQSLVWSFKQLCCGLFTRLPADFFDEAQQDSASVQLSKGPGPSLLSGNYDDDDDEEEEQERSSKSSVVHKTEIPPPTQEVVANSLPAGNACWNSKWFCKENLLFNWWWKFYFFNYCH